LQEYANDVVFAAQQACDEKGIDHPDIVSESGRALTAHHAILVFDVLGVSSQRVDVPKGAEQHENTTIVNMLQILKDLTQKNYLECYHAAQGRGEQPVPVGLPGPQGSRDFRVLVLGHLPSAQEHR
jgi:arginine decarboxylase